jgi:hypothetical protein
MTSAAWGNYHAVLLDQVADHAKPHFAEAILAFCGRVQRPLLGLDKT